MVTREEVVAKIQKVPERYLEELYRIIKDLEERSELASDSDQSVMAELRRIKISAPPDFSMRANLYDLEKDNAR